MVIVPGISWERVNIMLVTDSVVAVLAGTAVPVVKVNNLVLVIPKEQLVVAPPKEQETELENANWVFTLFVVLIYKEMISLAVNATGEFIVKLYVIVYPLTVLLLLVPTTRELSATVFVRVTAAASDCSTAKLSLV